jgi:hypothetical protein
MKTVKHLWKCADCKTGPCFSIMPDEEVPSYCQSHDFSEYDEDTENAFTEPVYWHQLGHIYCIDEIIDSHLIEEIFKA